MSKLYNAALAICECTASSSDDDNAELMASEMSCAVDYFDCNVFNIARVYIHFVEIGRPSVEVTIASLKAEFGDDILDCDNEMQYDPEFEAENFE